MPEIRELYVFYHILRDFLNNYQLAILHAPSDHLSDMSITISTPIHTGLRPTTTLCSSPPLHLQVCGKRMEEKAWAMLYGDLNMWGIWVLEESRCVADIPRHTAGSHFIHTPSPRLSHISFPAYSPGWTTCTL
ncbi:uncharacterized protein ARMOST_21774 [Armillaria ostoyae]|uniref:Uncharacterized protein n=1 Tax=Armillaria ostoyae TaxID=47428 RepID=A0A284R6F4_ARMOS|nr:uncharacterized protein ARMOST_07666 [Armillaria ostoyae]SJL18196.1 uncharacterized protein ARMOST_21774 [Armillaria ostoyae]